MSEMNKDFKTVERDVSWMYFNHRILEEAEREDVPVMDRINFLGIYSNNLDEFFRVRIAGLNRIANIKERKQRDEAARAREQLNKISKLNRKYAREYVEAVRHAIAALGEHNIFVVNERQLSQQQLAFVRDFYRHNLLGRLSAVWVERIKHFNTESDNVIYFIAKLSLKEKKPRYAILPLPTRQVSRWVELPETDGKQYIMYIDDVIRASLDLVFPGVEYDEAECYSFKFTRDAEMEIDNDLTKGYIQKVAKGVNSRLRGTPLRLVYDGDMPDGMLSRIMKRLGANSRTVVAVEGGRYQNHRDLMHFPRLGRHDLAYPALSQIDNVGLKPGESLIELIRRRDVMLHVPYHTFDNYIRLLSEAAISPRVKSIKTTLYRLAKDSKVVRALINAAENGKKVTVVIELLARFDEESNIDWSKRMQEAGIEVIFGVDKLKVHSKITHIGFTSGSAIACVSTGNFHEGNARAYTDLILMTSKRNITEDVNRCFSFIERPFAPIRFNELLVSPNEMRRKFISLIDREVKNHLQGRSAYIRCKLNHITDPDIVEKLYEAAEAGVKVDLLVRGNCSLTDNARLGNNMRVHGIIDRYLEHSRIFIFANAGDEQVYIGSADWMTRNLDLRIEVVAPVYDPDLKRECSLIVEWGMRDNRNGHVVVGPEWEEGTPDFRSQTALYEHYKSIDENGKEQE